MQSARQTSGLKRLKLLFTTALGNWGSDQVLSQRIQTEPGAAVITREKKAALTI